MTHDCSLQTGHSPFNMYDMRDKKYASVLSFCLQILEITVEFSGLFIKLDTIDRFVVAPAFPFHRDLRSSRHAGRFSVKHP